MALLQIEQIGHQATNQAVQVASKATEQLVDAVGQESTLVQLLFVIALVFGIALFTLAWGVIRRLDQRNQALVQRLQHHQTTGKPVTARENL